MAGRGREMITYEEALKLAIIYATLRAHGEGDEIPQDLATRLLMSGATKVLHEKETVGVNRVGLLREMVDTLDTLQAGTIQPDHNGGVKH